MKKAKRILRIITLLLIISTVFTLNIHALDKGFEAYSSGFFYTYKMDGYVIKASDYSLSGDVIIPDEINGKPVEAIADRGFSGSENITSITIPASVKYIGDRAFYNCKNLEKIIIQGEIIYMGSEILHGTKWYEAQSDGIVYIDDILCSYKGDFPESSDVTVKEGTRLIANHAFDAKGDIGKITIPSSVRIIGEHAFFNCSAEEVVFSDGLRKIDQNAFDSNNLTEVSLPDTVTQLGDAVFRANPIEKIKLSESLTELPDLFGTRCPDTLHIPKNVQKIDFDMFANAQISNLTIDKENKFYWTDGYGLYNGDATVLYLYLDKQTECPVFADTTKTLSERSFFCYTNIKELVFPSSLKSIETHAFYNCNKLEKITFNDGLETIESFSFAICSSLKELVIPDSVTKINSGAFLNCSDLTYVKLPQGLTELESIFTECKNLNSLHIPKNIKKIADFVFHHNNYIERITVDEENEYFSSDENGVLFNKDKTTLIQYPLAKTAESYSIPETVINIGDYAFEGNSHLKKVVIPESIEKIGKCAFYCCSKLYDVVLPEKAILVNTNAFTSTKVYNDHPKGVIYIGKIACGHKGNIQERCIILRDDTLSIAQNAFNSLNITDIMIYDKLLNIAPGAFNKTKLENVHYSGTEEQWNKIDISDESNTPLVKAAKHYSTVKHIFTSSDISGATFGKNGTIIKYCVCGYSEKGVYYGINEKVLSQTDFVYNGKEQAPKVVLKNLNGDRLTGIAGYEIPSVKDVGKYKITFKLREPYEGQKTVYFTIRPDSTEKIDVSQTTSSVTLKWSKVKKATGYRVYQYNPSTGKWKTLKTTTERTFTIKNLKAGTKYEFCVKAYTKTADGTIWSKSSVAIETATKPATPTLKLSSLKKSTASIKWTNVKGESGYQVYYSTKKNVDYKKVDTYKANVTNTSKTKLSSGKTYYFKVRAYIKTSSGTVYGAFSPVQSIKIK